ncbi:hypothetical protein GCWU000282_00270 [Catonella morbi ATCC 51271]|uniref:Uncharacterized protein n=1 Tax=Catonella morbi ATCC 51271 TaxID=592026 RepID=V2YA68_9FIRM|nr:hypothetical protein GCWU000282_00270 [Catonella morbi ATCC 51271]
MQKNERITNILQGPGEVKPKQSCIIGCQIILTPTSFNINICKFRSFSI